MMTKYNRYGIYAYSMTYTMDLLSEALTHHAVSFSRPTAISYQSQVPSRISFCSTT